MLTLINFPRKQIGKTMSDCLTTGVLPAKAGVSEQEKRDSTVYVRPFLGHGDQEKKAAMLEPGSKVGVMGEDGLVESNSRDLRWDEFTKVKFLVGKVLNVATAATNDESGSSIAVKDNLDLNHVVPIPLTINFGVEVGHKHALVYLRPGFIQPDELLGRQILAVTNVEAVQPTDGTKQDASVLGVGVESNILVLTVGGKTTVEPAKEVENGFCLA